MMTPSSASRPLILASGSPRRIEMLSTCGLAPQVLPSSYEEKVPFRMHPAERAMFFALGKALAVRRQHAEECGTAASAPSSGQIPMIVGADTIVVFRNEIMEKPKDKDDGMQMLMALSGETHQVITGVCLADADGRLTKCFYESTDVTFCAYSEAEMDAYLDTDEAYDKAGGYGIQGTFSKYVTEVAGDVDNVIGFPLARFLKEKEIYEQILKNGRL